MAENERLFRPERAHKLDDPERLKWLPPDVVVRQIARPGLRVADVGAGSGYFALSLARAVLPEVARTLQDNGWRVDTSESIGPYNYFIVAVGDRRP